MSKKKVKKKMGGWGVDGRDVNTRVEMTLARAGGAGGGRAKHRHEGPLQGLIATWDPCDRAHDVREPGSGFLVNGASVESSKPREYPRCYQHERVKSEMVEEMVGGVMVARTVERAVAVVSDETVLDETWQKQQWLRAQGLEVCGVGRVAEAYRESVMSHPRNRDLVRPRRRRMASEDEAALRKEIERAETQ